MGKLRTSNSRNISMSETDNAPGAQIDKGEIRLINHPFQSLEDAAEMVRLLDKQAHDAARTAIQCALEAGLMLEKVRDQLRGHLGGFLAWINSTCAVSQKTCYRYLDLVSEMRRRGGVVQIESGKTLTGLYLDWGIIAPREVAEAKPAEAPRQLDFRFEVIGDVLRLFCDHSQRVLNQVTTEDLKEKSEQLARTKGIIDSEIAAREKTLDAHQ